MNILFLGLLYQYEYEKIILADSKLGLQGAGNTYQWNLIRGMDELPDCSLQIMSTLPVGTYPGQYRKLLVRSRSWSHKAGIKDEEIGFINLPVLKQLLRYIIFYRKVAKWCKDNTGEKPVLMIYSLYLPYLKVMAKMKRKFPDLKACIIVPDLPNAFGLADKFSLGKLLFKKLGQLKYQYAKAADASVLLTGDMAEPLEVQDKPHVVIEGISNPQPAEEERNDPPEELKIILYTGTLNARFGLDQLIRGFRLITQDNYALWLCGTGDYVKEIEEAAKEDLRIRYFGYMTSDTIRAMQQHATLLINPRQNGEEYTRYSFPSKTIEYMASGRPVLMFKLDGIPSDYDDYLYYIEDNSPEGIKAAILSVGEKDREELLRRGMEAREFVRRCKNGKAQAGKILAMLKDAEDKKAALSPQNLKLFPGRPGKTVLQINITCGYGSTGRIVEELHNLVMDEGYQSYVAYSAFGSSLVEAFPIENRIQNYARRALNRICGRKYGHSLPGTLRLIRKIKELKPDLIHLHNIQQNSVDFPFLMNFLKKYDVPVIYTLHDCWAFTGGCYHFTELGCDGYQYGCPEKICKLDAKQKDICNRTTDQINVGKNKALHALHRLRIICVSEWLKSCAEASFMKDLPLRVIYNGIDTDIFRPVYSRKREELGISEDEFIILGAANHWNKSKGLDIFFRLSEILDYPYRIVMVGLSLKDCPEGICAVERTEDLQELAELYSCADVFFNASREETFGLAAAEAMACGTPVIAFRSTACKETVNEDTGILLDTDRITDVSIAIENIRNNGKQQYAGACTRHIRENFSKERMESSYLKLYKELLEEED